jgi:hypothetical protein
MNIGSINEYEAQGAIIPFVGVIIRKGYELRQQYDIFLLVGVFRQRKQADFSQCRY